MSARRVARTAVNFPSASAANSMVCFWARPWIVDVAASVRVSVQRTVPPWRLAKAMQMSSSAYTFSLQPKPPPTLGAMTRNFCSGMPKVRAPMTFRTWGIWVDE